MSMHNRLYSCTIYLLIIVLFIIINLLLSTKVKTIEDYIALLSKALLTHATSRMNFKGIM